MRIVLYKPSFCASPLALRTGTDRDTETRSMSKPVAILKPHKAKHLIVPLLSTGADRGAEANYGSVKLDYETDCFFFAHAKGLSTPNSRARRKI